MRVRVRFRFRADTGEVEVYEVDTVGQGVPAPDHDARHDRVVGLLARVVEENAEIEEDLSAAPRRDRGTGDARRSPAPLPEPAGQESPERGRE
ncbi:hypothetical protein GCM10009639_24340 [Kitasatospora putterlickiae]|uniref:FtsH ternary system domain-containing protein n=1 Tax=Kitasatospora putterlickiae TaxID=221725 RepID=A0ABN1Y005_9ACTN